MSDDAARHLNPESLEEYFRLDLVSVFVLSKSADARLEIDPGKEQLRLYVPADGTVPDVTEFARIQVDTVYGSAGERLHRLIFDAGGMHYTAYQLIESVVARLRDGTSFQLAVALSIADMKDLLTNRGRLTDEQEVGLWGELLLLEVLIEKIGELEAIKSWLGPTKSEHDFSFGDFEAEVKTTRSEARRHRIGSETQLESSPNRPLYFVSVQVTLAGAASGGRTLPRLIDDVRGRLKMSSGSFDAALIDIGYRSTDADLYGLEYQLRSDPRAYFVDDLFPAITRSLLARSTPFDQLLSDIHYRVDVRGLQFSAPPVPLNHFCEVPA